MPNEYQQSPRIKKVKGNAIYNYYEAPTTGPDKPAEPARAVGLGMRMAHLC
jgi:hypothetical protein